MKRFSLSPRAWLLISIAFLLVLLELSAILPDWSSPLERGDYAFRDWFLRLARPVAPHPDIVIAAIDDFSLAWNPSRWPWPRRDLAEIVNWLNAAGARAIGVDIFLFEPDSDPQGDLALAEALRQAEFSAGVLQVTRDPSLGTETLHLPLPLYRQVFDGLGITAVRADEDAVLRAVPACDSFDGQVFCHWAFALARSLLQAESPVPVSQRALLFNGRLIPLYQGRILVPYAGPTGTYPYYSAARIPLGDYPPEAFRGKIVLLGATSSSLQDIYPTPFSARRPMPGVEVIANLLAAILAGVSLQVAPVWVNLVAIALMALLAAWIGRLHSPAWMLATMLTGMLVYALLALLVFVRFRLFLPVTGAETMLFLGVVLPGLEQAIAQEREKARIRRLFSRFIAPAMVEQLLQTPRLEALNKRADLTILFSDIRGFTSLSERLAPEQVVALLNPYLAEMTEIIHRNGGTVDKYEGDAILAFFGEPLPMSDHARRAVRAALEMRLALDGLMARWSAQGIAPERFEIGVGLDCGEVFVGLLGSEQRINYTVIGDHVNLAARIQDLTKTYAWPVLMSEAVYRRVEAEFDCEFVAETQVKGKQEPVRLYKLIGLRGASQESRLRAYKTVEAA
ncbi:MAG: adenylate/guanylate cyclase domain-containing protein [Anaerolineales bacterium]|nr:adenylate/guanylate cyclase domain-containing protein [Anaerolineales bacterium]MCX7755900.1 adenylate/guanylate cyclase domain-containing protein [Anaerolineales bacterium]MDW8277936.1 adenylate/guanylate cyclase domain-containing protein [Anaerolineales bacterium]